MDPRGELIDLVGASIFYLAVSHKPVSAESELGLQISGAEESFGKCEVTARTSIRDLI